MKRLFGQVGGKTDGVTDQMRGTLKLEHRKQLTYWTEYVWSLIPRVPSNNAFSRISRETKSPLLGNPPTRSPKLLPSDRIGT